VTTPRIVRYPLPRWPTERGAFWSDDGAVRYCREHPGGNSAEWVAKKQGGWTATESDAAACGTTLAAIREALTREESGGC
jgi:predicted NUDIX family NTP pyrophosphohydrolase